MEYGCAACFHGDADHVWNNRAKLASVARIVDESHFIVTLLRCRTCEQAFAAVFCETIDWAGGDDPQDWLVIPLTACEADLLAGVGEQAVEAALRALRPPRRYLVRSFARAATHPEVRWSDGPIWLPFHD